MKAVAVRDIIQNSVPLSNFNKGMAGKIFTEVRQNGTKIVMKNNLPECVLMSPEEYIELMDELEDMRLLLLAEDRIKNSSGKVYTQEEVMEELGITDEELDSMEDVEIE